MKKKCIDCGIPLIGRSDKKFCSDMCRNAYHNKFNGYRNALMRHVNSKLRKNRKILCELLRSEKNKLSKEELSINGFDWQFFTEETKLESGVWRFCYDYGISYINNETVQIISKPYKSRNTGDNIGLAAEDLKHY